MCNYVAYNRFYKRRFLHLSLNGLRVRGISPVGKEKVYGGKDLLKSQVLSSEWNTERVRKDASGDSEDGEYEDAVMVCVWRVNNRERRCSQYVRDDADTPHINRRAVFTTFQHFRTYSYEHTHPQSHIQRMQIEEQISKTHSVQFWSVLLHGLSEFSKLLLMRRKPRFSEKQFGRSEWVLEICSSLHASPSLSSSSSAAAAALLLQSANLSLLALLM